MCMQVIKEAMDSKFGGPFHCVCGQSFAFEVTHEVSPDLFEGKLRAAPANAERFGLLGAAVISAPPGWQVKSMMYVFVPGATHGVMLWKL